MNDRPKLNADGGPGAPVNPEMLASGYAAGNLTDAEQRRLMEEALQRQDLFDELMAEQPLKDLFEDDAVRSAVIEALQKQPTRWEWFRFWWSRPWAWGTAGALATGLLVVAFFGTNPPSLLENRNAAPEAELLADRLGPKVQRSGEISPGESKPQPSAETGRATTKPSGTPDGRAVAVPPGFSKAASPRPEPALADRAKRELTGSKDRPAVLATPAAAAPETPAAPAPGAQVPSIQASAAPKAVPPVDTSGPAEVSPREAERRKAERDTGRSRVADAAPPAPLNEGRPEQERARLAPVTPTATPRVRVSATPAQGMPTQGMAVTLLRQTAGGGFEPVASGQAVAPTEGLKLQMNPAVSGWVTLQRRDQAGTIETISERQRVERGSTAVIPSQGTFAASLGPQTLTLRFVADEPAAPPPAAGLQNSFRVQGGARVSAGPGQPAAPVEAGRIKPREGGAGPAGASTADASTSEAGKARAGAAESAAGSAGAVIFEIRVVGRP
jgi:hypothetical protein